MSKPLPEVEIIHLDDPNVSGAAISIPGQKEPLLVWPFREVRLREAFVLDPNTVLCVGSDDRGPLALSRIHVPSGEVFQTATLNARPFERLIRDNRTLYVLGHFPDSLIAVDIATLTIRFTHNVALMSGHRGRLARSDNYFRIDSSIKDGDARVFHTAILKEEYLSGPVLHLHPTHWCAYEPTTKRLVFLNEDLRTHTKCLVEVDVESGTLVQLSEKPLESDEIGHICLLDAERRTLILKSSPLIPVSTGTDATEAEAFGYRLPNVINHPDVTADGVWRYGAALSVNDYRGGKVDSRTIVVRMARAADWGGDTSYLSDLEIDECLRLRATKIANRHDRELQRRAVVRWDAEKKTEQKLVLPVSLQFGLLAYPLAVEPSGNAFWVWFSDDCVRRVAYDGELGALIRLEPRRERNRGSPKIDFEPGGRVVVHRPPVGTYRFHTDEIKRGGAPSVPLMPSEPYAEPVTHKAAFAAYVHARSTIRIVLAEWSRAECAKALREQKARIGCSFEKLLVGPPWSARYLKFEYLIGAETCSEPEFFQRIADHGFDVVSELRELLESYLDKLGEGGEGKQPWYTNSIPAMGCAMRALALLDASSTDILRTFMAKRDGEHESYCGSTIVPDLIKRHGWRDRTMLQFGVFVVLNVRWGGSGGGDANCYGLLTAAETQVSASEFADMVIAEIKQFEMVQQWNEQDEVWQLQEFCSGLDLNRPFQAELRARLEASLPG